MPPAAGVGLAVVASLFLPWLGARWAGDAEAASDPARAVVLAKRARSVDPLSVEPLYAEAFAEISRGRTRRAATLLHKATEVQPKNPQTWLHLGLLELDVGCAHAALPHLRRYVELDPQARPSSGGDDYHRALDLVNSGKPKC